MMSPRKSAGRSISTCKHEFYDFGAAYQIISSNSGDTTQTVTLSYRDAAGNIQTEVKTPRGANARRGDRHAPSDYSWP